MYNKKIEGYVCLLYWNNLDVILSKYNKGVCMDIEKRISREYLSNPYFSLETRVERLKNL